MRGEFSGDERGFCGVDLIINNRRKVRKWEASWRCVLALALCFCLVAIAVGGIAKCSGARFTIENTDGGKSIVHFWEMNIFVGEGWGRWF